MVWNYNKIMPLKYLFTHRHTIRKRENWSYPIAPNTYHKILSGQFSRASLTIINIIQMDSRYAILSVHSTGHHAFMRIANKLSNSWYSLGCILRLVSLFPNFKQMKNDWRIFFTSIIERKIKILSWFLISTFNFFHLIEVQRLYKDNSLLPIPRY